jgi:hypothetical protein
MFDLHTSILDADYNEELDEERLQDYIHQLMVEFERSPEAEACLKEFDTSLCWPATYMQYAAQYFCATPATVTPGETAEILFEIFPRKVSVESEAAHEIVAELRSFWQFLKRTRSLESADAMLEMLTDSDASHLEAALTDPSNFGMAKSFFAAGANAGFDMTNQADMNRFMLAYNAALQGGAPVDDQEVKSAIPIQQSTPIDKQLRRVGRNDLCPCGSGRKYKKCCIR